MTSVVDLFESLTSFPIDNAPSVLMGDDQTLLRVSGYGYINYIVHGKRIRHLAYYVPGLGTTLFSVKQHIQNQGCYFHAAAQDTHLAFPKFLLSPRVDAEIDMIAKIDKDSDIPLSFNEEDSTKVSINQQQNQNKRKIKTTNIRILSKDVKKFIPDRQEQAKYVRDVNIHTILPKAGISTSRSPTVFQLSSPITFSILPRESKTVPSGLQLTIPEQVSIDCSSSLHSQCTSSVIPCSLDATTSLSVSLKNPTDNVITFPAGTPFASLKFMTGNTPWESFHTAPGAKPTAIPSTHSKPRISKVCIPKHLFARWAKIKQQSKVFIDDYATKSLRHLQKLLKSHRVSTLPSISEENTSFLQPSKPNSSLPKTISLPRDTLLQSIGFRKPDSLLQNFQKLAQPTVTIQRDTNPQPLEGSFATMKSARRNTNPTKLPSKFNDTWNIDIGYGPTVSLGGIKYTLMCVDRSTRFRRVYGLKNLKSSLFQAIQQFLIDCGSPPKCLLTDFDSKLFRGKVGALLKKHQISIKSSPPIPSAPKWTARKALADGGRYGKKLAPPISFTCQILVLCPEEGV